MVTLNKKQSAKFLKNMLKKERSPVTRDERKLAKEVQKVGRIFEMQKSMEPVKIHDKMPLKGEHLIMTLRVNDDLEKTEYLKKILFEAIHKSKATIINFVEHKFEPQGYSIVVLIGESHASIHTYPEEQGIFIDYFTCGDIKTKVFKDYMLSKLKVIEMIELGTFERGEQ